MKTMTCREMGGLCDHEISAQTAKEMMDEGMKHLKKEHPEMAQKMSSMSKEENDQWKADFMKRWDGISEG
jgi:predicted small metal-binding protein